MIVNRCKGCAFCVEYCPKHILKISRRFNKKGYHYPELVSDAVCVDCNLCEAICPEFAIFSEPVEDSKPVDHGADRSGKTGASCC